MTRLTAGVCLLWTACGAAAAADGVFPYPYHKHTLPNGLTAVMIPMDSPGLVAYYSVVRTGSRDEVEPGRSGFAHFFEHMMFRGTKKYPGPVYDRIVTGLGADANAFTTDDFTAYHLTFAKEDLEKVIEIESDRFQNLDYDEAGVPDRGRRGLRRVPQERHAAVLPARREAAGPAFDVHTYKHTTMGFEADVKAMPEAYEYSLSFFQRFYRPENVVLLIVGDVDPKATLALVEKYYGAWKKGYVAAEDRARAAADKRAHGRGRPIPADAADPGHRLQGRRLRSGQPRLRGRAAAGRPGLRRDAASCTRSSCSQSRRCEFIGADFPMNRDLPLFEIVAMVKKAEDIDYVRDEIYRTLEEFKTKPVDAQKLDDVKRHNKYAFLMDSTRPTSVAERAGPVRRPDRRHRGGRPALRRDGPGHAARTCMRAAKKYFVPERRTVVVLKGAAMMNEPRHRRVLVARQ